MTLTSLFARLSDDAVGLSVKDGELVVKARRQVLADGSLVALLREHKSQIIGVVASGEYERLLRRSAVPPNGITAATTVITPGLLPLIDLTPEEIDRIVSEVPGGAANIQDIYALSPLQEGILFHHVLGDGADPYVLSSELAFATRARLDEFLRAVQQVVDRHDILRTSIHWEGLSKPAQVVWRRAPLHIDEGDADPCIDLTRAPLLRFVIAPEPDGARWRLRALQHHLIGDHSTMEVLHAEVRAILAGRGEALEEPQPFRNLVARARLGVSAEEHERFFRAMLEDVDEPTLPFGLADVRRDGSGVAQSRRWVDDAVSARLRQHARRLGVSVASLCHLAWGQVLARTSGREQVVFGTVLFGRAQGSDRSMGLFINTLPVRLDLDGTPLEERVRTTHRRLTGLLRHEHASLALAQRCSGVAAPAPLFSALLNYRHSEGGGEGEEPLDGIEWLGGHERTNFPLSLSIDDLGEALALTARVVTSVSADRVVDLMARALEDLVERLDHAPQSPTRALDVLPASERTLLLDTWNATGAPYPAGLCLHQLFEEQVRKTPNVLAVVQDETALTFAELNARANRLAHGLIAHGVRPDDRVALNVDRSPGLVIGILGILKAGGAYVPLDPANPRERLDEILADAEPVAIVCDAAGRQALGDRPMLDVYNNVKGEELDANPDVPMSAHNLAYVLYTSGSTGKPKGVMIEHQSVANLRTALEEAIYRGRDYARVGWNASFQFDASVKALVQVLSGRCLVILPSHVRATGDAFMGYLQTHQVDVIDCTPSQLDLLLPFETLESEVAWPKAILIGGEAIPQTTWTRLAAIPHRTFHNVYGPTECTVDATATIVRGDTPAIGRPLANVQIYLLDPHQQPVPIGVTGELHIGGLGVARGYWKRDALTAERFLDTPFGRLYRTGDLARHRPDGTIESLGRNDRQVKIRGFRIEPGEIEARLREHPQVRDCAVVARDERLVAYLVGDVDPASVREHLSGQLPDAMVPSAFVTLEALPLTRNGKLDRKALPAPDASAVIQREYEPPRTPTEEILAKIWTDLLKVDRIGRDDDFFALGGHSLVAVRLLSRLQQLAGELPLTLVFTHPTLRAMAGEVARRQHAAAAVAPIGIVPRDTPLPLSFAQQRLWFLDRLDGSTHYHVPFGLRLRGPLDAPALRASLDRLVARHEILRSRFIEHEGEPRFEPMPPETPFALIEHDLRGDPNAEERVEELWTGELRTPFDLATGPLVRGRLIRVAEDEHVLLVTHHHIVTDGWSMGIFATELGALYRGQSLPPLAIQYADYAAWQREWLRGERLEQQAGYWRQRLDGAPVLLELPTDRPRPAQQSFAGATLDVVIDRELAAALQHLSQSHGTTLFMTLLAAWSVVLARLSGQDDLVIGVPTANRGRAEVEPLVGFFVNTLALRLDLSGLPATAELLARVRAAALAAQDHQDLPFEQVVEIVQPPRRLAHSPLFQVLFAWQNVEERHFDLPNLDVAPLDARPSAVKFDLELALGESDGCIVGGLLYATALFDRSTIERYRGHFLAVLRAMVAEPAKPVARIDILSAAERTLLLDTWNATAVPYPAERGFHELFEEHARATPDAIAVAQHGTRITYAELDARANDLARLLRARGVTPDDRVAVCVDRRPYVVTAFLAALKAGGAYLPLDPSYPAARLAELLDDAKPAILLTDAAGRRALGDAIAGLPSILDLDREIPAVTGTIAPAFTPGTIAYVIYTSGSTGKPKGVLVGHRGLVNLAHHQAASFGTDATSRVGAFFSIGFDGSVFELVMALGSGATLCLAASDDRHGAAFSAYLRDEGVTHAVLAPAMLDGDADLGPLRWLMLAGDVAPASIVRALPPLIAVVNGYGPTEGTIWTTAWSRPADFDGLTVPIGRPIANTRIYLLDAHRNPVPLGATGELCLAGVGVAHGYLNRPELTAECFVDDPFAGGTMYRTGDRARYRGDGNLEFAGRNDGQVKLRGFRVEVGEIEARLREHSAVRECAVIAREQRLVAYVVPVHRPLDAATLRDDLRRQLPDYMIPAAFVTLERLPLTPNGKLDRKALPEPDASALVQRAYDPPAGAIEETIAAIWCELLKLDRAGRDDHFFELGGHSLLAVRFLSRLQQRLGVELPLATLFADATLRAIAAAARQRRDTSTRGAGVLPASRAVAEKPLALSFAQQRLWFLDQLDPGSTHYHVPFVVELQGALDVAALRASLDALVARHEVLRSRFVAVDGSACVDPLPADSGFALLEQTGGDVARIFAEEMRTPFDLARGPLVRGRLIRLDDDRHVLLIVFHHIITDAWSMGIFLDELDTLYRGNPLPPLEIQYADYAAWQREWLSGERLQEQVDYWRRQLAGAPVLLELPTDRPRPADQSFAGASVDIHVDEELTAALQRLSRERGMTLFMTVLAAWSVVLSRLSGQEEVVIGIPSANRNRAEVERLIGFFVNSLALRVDLSGQPSANELLARVRATAVAAQDHQDLPFEQVVEIVQPPRRLAHTPVFQVLFAWERADAPPPELPGLTAAPFHLPLETAKFDLELGLVEADGCLVGGLSYATALFDAGTIERHHGYLLAALRAMVADPAAAVAEIDLLSPAERALQLDVWNRNDAPYPAELCIHEQFEEQARRRPDAIAVVQGDRALTYRQMNERANQLARHLRGQGVRPDDRVALCYDRGLEMIVGIFAILKAGGAYVPMDPSHPAARNRSTLEDSGAVYMVDASLPAGTWSSRSAENLDRAGLTPRNLAYVIYTSGSTGQPNGVMIEHESLSNQVATLRDRFAITGHDRVLQFASITFDSSVEEIFPALLSGATLVLRDDSWIAGAREFWGLCERFGVTVIDLPTRFWQSILADRDARIPPCTRLVFVGGEAVDRASVAEWFRRGGHRPRLFNSYGPTETTVNATIGELLPDPATWQSIGRPVDNMRLYVLDPQRRLVPIGAAGELYAGGVCVARGYLNRPEVTARRFVDDPFVPGARLYRTGDLVRYRADGNVEYLGRTDHQVKIRGFRVELGEIEARLAEHDDVADCAVLAREDTPGDKRLVAYVVPKRETLDPGELRAHLRTKLPDYMVPAAFVTLDRLPLTPSRKLDRKALPAPDASAVVQGSFEPPAGEVEETVAAIWAALLKLDRVGRHDHFFELGGHSLMAVQLLERLRRAGLRATIRDLFDQPVLSAFAATMGSERELVVPPNRINPETTAITPDLLPLIALSQDEIDRIVARVPGGVANVQDIYALSPLQDGILFHHLLAKEGDPYLLQSRIAFPSRARLDEFIAAMQQVVARHDILRTAVHWEGLSAPAQVVWRHAPFPVTEVALQPDEDLGRRFDPRHYKIDLQQAPLLHYFIAREPGSERWILLELQHHLIGDHSTGDVMYGEVAAILEGRAETLDAPRPFRDLVAQARLGVSEEEHERFFREMLADVDEPTLPFGLSNVHRDGSGVVETRHVLPEALNQALRGHAKRLGVSLASLCHLAWGQVLARTSGREQVVFGTVLFGRMQGSDRTLGLFINTLPLRLDLDGTPLEESARTAHRRLAGLLRHEHASLALAQRCSGVVAPAPLFSALLNYRHNEAAPPAEQQEADPFEGIELLGAEERTNYPVALSVEDSGDALGLTAQVIDGIEAERICALMERALEDLADRLTHAPQSAVRDLDVLPAGERTLLLETWNDTAAPYPADRCLHELFEQQVAMTPDATALVQDELELTYRELDARANRLARHLRRLGVGPDRRAVLWIERRFEMIVGLLAVLKAGGAYVPLDPSYPEERIRYVLDDSEAVVLLTGAAHGDYGVPVVDLTATETWSDEPVGALEAAGVTPDHLAYVIYTSGSTGEPNGVLIEHRAVVSHIAALRLRFGTNASDRLLQFSAITFDGSVEEIFGALLNGAALVLRNDRWLAGAQEFWSLCERFGITMCDLPTRAWQSVSVDGVVIPKCVRVVFIGGEAADRTALAGWFRRAGHRPRLFNGYGPTEATVVATVGEFLPDEVTWQSIGRPIANTRAYVLDERRRPVPIGATGELYLGGERVARGYLNRPGLTTRRFAGDPFVPGARVYRTGDLVRLRSDGSLEFLGRNDDQVKIRGFRIELGEVEARLDEHPGVAASVVLAREDTPGDKRLVAYVVPRDAVAPDNDWIVSLREHLRARLPDSMMPAAFVTLERLPLSTSGKLDRKALPAPDASAYLQRAYEPPKGELEQAVAAIWAELLHVERLGRHDHFFELGGHSLLAVRLLTRIQSELDLRCELSLIFDHPQLAAFAKQLLIADLLGEFTADDLREAIESKGRHDGQNGS